MTVSTYNICIYVEINRYLPAQWLSERCVLTYCRYFPHLRTVLRILHNILSFCYSSSPKAIFPQIYQVIPHDHHIGVYVSFRLQINKHPACIITKYIISTFILRMRHHLYFRISFHAVIMCDYCVALCTADKLTIFLHNYSGWGFYFQLQICLYLLCGIV